MKLFITKFENSFFRKKTYSSYDDALQDCLYTGYKDEDLAKMVYRKTELLKENLSRGSDIKTHITGSMNILVSVLKDFCAEACVLDFGGACGAHYFIIKKILGPNYRINWAVVETKMMCKYGKELENGELRFFDNIEAAKLHIHNVDVINVSGSLQYTTEPYGFLNSLLEADSKFILFSRMCFTAGNKDIVTIQKSMLSMHGNGKLPRGFRDKEIRCPFTAIQKSKFDHLLRSKYEYLKIFEDNSGLIRMDNEPIFGSGLLCKHKTAIP